MLLYRSTHRARTRGRHRLHPDRNGSDGCCTPTYPPRDACRLRRSARWGGGGRLLHAYVRVDCWASPVRGAALSLTPEVASESRLPECAGMSPEVSQPTRESDATLDPTEARLGGPFALTGLSPASSSSWLDR